MSILNKLFPCSEVRWIKDEIKLFFNSNPSAYSQEVILESNKVASDVEKSKYSIRVDGMKPAQLALLIIRNTVFHKIISGNNHLHRGILSNRGAEYLKIFTVAVNTSAALGFESQEEAQSDIADLHNEIKMLG